MPFEKFTETGRSYQTKISIRGNGQIGFNLGSIQKFSVANHGYAVLYYDREQKRMGIQLTDDAREEGSKKLIVRRSSASIAAKAFLDYYEIEYGKKVRKFNAHYDANEKMIIVSLSE